MVANVPMATDTMDMSPYSTNTIDPIVPVVIVIKNMITALRITCLILDFTDFTPVKHTLLLFVVKNTKASVNPQIKEFNGVCSEYV